MYYTYEELKFLLRTLKINTKNEYMKLNRFSYEKTLPNET